MDLSELFYLSPALSPNAARLPVARSLFNIPSMTSSLRKSRLMRMVMMMGMRMRIMIPSPVPFSPSYSFLLREGLIKNGYF